MRRNKFSLDPVTQIKKNATIWTPTTSNQTIKKGTILLGDQTIAGDSDLTAANIKSGVDIFGVTGTLTSGFPVYSLTEVASSWGGYLANKNITGPGVACLYVGGKLYSVFFKNSITTDSSGVATVDTINTGRTLTAYSIGSSQPSLQLKIFYGSRTNLNISGSGVIYLDGPITLFYSNGFTTDGSSKPTINGSAWGQDMIGYSN